MEEEDKHTLLQPLIPFLTTSSSSITTTISFAAASSSSNSLIKSYDDKHYEEDTNNNAKLFLSDNSIILRILIVFLVAIISIWANYEASKTFEINIVNDIKDSPAGRRFALYYVSNDKASRIVLNTSSFVENFLYPNNLYTKKHIDTVPLRLSRRNLTAAAAVSATGTSQRDYVVDISPMLLENENYNKVIIVGAVQLAMARVWLWDGGSRAPHGLVDGMAEYVAELAGFHRERLSGRGGELPECRRYRWWEDKDPTHVAHFLHYFEEYNNGFIQRLNEAMRDTWHDRLLDDVLGMPAIKVCGSHNASLLSGLKV